MYIEWEFFISPIFGALFALVSSLISAALIKDEYGSSFKVLFKTRFKEHGTIIVLITSILTAINKLSS
ncbi:hypothetical protein CXF68_20240 [Tenacibaculum sp. Bg11-29]|uniref:hypothetical protein n=1 Tax=Tenacibaculum sp. Bg11-29 TaxID=2058306 RepID=UPI000C33121A|nr:hypothetical protein [Tenacibaculum sp. Bg11-29]PKH52885.1 hypothetical protein CXF68_20240 [Tenacibaculum sp. Bg11-29]